MSSRDHVEVGEAVDETPAGHSLSPDVVATIGEHKGRPVVMLWHRAPGEHGWVSTLPRFPTGHMPDRMPRPVPDEASLATLTTPLLSWPMCCALSGRAIRGRWEWC